MQEQANNSSNQQVHTAVQQYIQYTMMAGIGVGNPDVVRLPASSRSTGRRQVGSHERFFEHVENDGHLNKQLHIIYNMQRLSHIN